MSHCLINAIFAYAMKIIASLDFVSSLEEVLSSDVPLFKYLTAVKNLHSKRKLFCTWNATLKGFER